MARYLADAIYEAPVFAHTSATRAEVFDAFREAAPPSVLVSPSARYGEGFPGRQA